MEDQEESGSEALHIPKSYFNPVSNRRKDKDSNTVLITRIKV